MSRVFLYIVESTRDSKSAKSGLSARIMTDLTKHVPAATRDILPDIEFFMDCLRASHAELLALTETAPAKKKASAKKKAAPKGRVTREK
jgi:hypothetical protein